MGFSYLAFVFNFLCLGIFGTFEKQVKNKDFEGVGTVLVKKTVPIFLRVAVIVML